MNLYPSWIRVPTSIGCETHILTSSTLSRICSSPSNLLHIMQGGLCTKLLLLSPNNLFRIMHAMWICAPTPSHFRSPLIGQHGELFCSAEHTIFTHLLIDASLLTMLNRRSNEPWAMIPLDMTNRPIRET